MHRLNEHGHIGAEDAESGDEFFGCSSTNERVISGVETRTRENREHLPMMFLLRSGLSSPTAHFLNSSCALTAPEGAAFVISARLDGTFLDACCCCCCDGIAFGTFAVLAAADGATVTGAGAGVFALPLAPTVVHAPLEFVGGLTLGDVGVTFPAR